MKKANATWVAGGTLRRAAQLLSCTALAALLTACNRPPPYHPPQMALPPSWSGEGPFRVATPQDGVLRKDWWTLFHDPELDRLEEKAVASNPDLQAAAEVFQQARYLSAEAKSGLYPHVSVGAGTSDNKQSEHNLFRDPGSPIYDADQEYGAVASWEPDIWSKIRNTVRMQQQAAQQDAALYALAKLSIQAELAQDYMELRGYDAEDAVYRQSIAYYQKALDITNLRLHGDIAPRSDVTRSENQLKATQAAETELLLQRDLVEHAIAILTNEAPTTFHLAPRDELGVAVPTVPVGVPSTLLQRRPDIASSERRMAQANTSIGIARAAFYPDITLTAGAGMRDNKLDLANLGNSMWSYGMAAALPLFQGGLRRAELQRSYAEYRQTTDEYRSTVLSAFKEVEDSLSRTERLGTEAQQQQEAVKAALATQTMSMSLYTGDLTNYLDVVVAQVAALEARLKAIEVETRRLEGSVSLVRALGGGWDDSAIPALDQISPMKATQYRNLNQPPVAGGIEANQKPQDNDLSGGGKQK